MANSVDKKAAAQYEDLVKQYEKMQTKAWTSQNVGEGGDTSLADLKKKLTSFVDQFGGSDKQKTLMDSGLSTMQNAVDKKMGKSGNDNVNWDRATHDIEDLLSDLKESTGATSSAKTWASKDGSAKAENEPKGKTSVDLGGSAAAGSVKVPKVAIKKTVTVSSTEELKRALAGAQSGTEIKLKAGTYTGPIKMANLTGVTLSGSKDAIIKAGEDGYALHVENCNESTLTGFSVKGGQKTLMADNSSNNVFDNLDLSGAQMEILHLRKNSSNNTVQNNSIHDSGLGGDKPASQASNGSARTYAMNGEGVYIGTAQKTSGSDASNNNTIIGNHIYNTTGENIDIKENTSGGVISGNKLDGSKGIGKEGGGRNIDVKGSGYTVSNNTFIHKKGPGVAINQVNGSNRSGQDNKVFDNG